MRYGSVNFGQDRALESVEVGIDTDGVLRTNCRADPGELTG